jgi:hypothetical protein
VAAVSGDGSEDELAATREALEARLGDCWDRLEDVISELVGLHGVADADILERVQAVIAAER